MLPIVTSGISTETCFQEEFQPILEDGLFTELVSSKNYSLLWISASFFCIKMEFKYLPLYLIQLLISMFNCSFTGNAGLCGIPGLLSCGPHLSIAAKVGIALGALFAFVLLLVCMTCWWKRRQNILRAQRIAACKDTNIYESRTSLLNYTTRLSSIFTFCLQLEKLRMQKLGRTLLAMCK